MTGKRILVIEDDLDTRVLYGECLTLEGFEVIETSDGQEALDYLSKQEMPRLVLMDYTVPRLGGGDFIRKFRALPGTDKVSLVVLSGWDDLAERVKGLGVQGFLKKPCDLDTLINLVRRNTTDAV